MAPEALTDQLGLENVLANKPITDRQLRLNAWALLWQTKQSEWLRSLAACQLLKIASPDTVSLSMAAYFESTESKPNWFELMLVVPRF